MLISREPTEPENIDESQRKEVKLKMNFRQKEWVWMKTKTMQNDDDLKWEKKKKAQNRLKWCMKFAIAGDIFMHCANVYLSSHSSLQPIVLLLLLVPLVLRVLLVLLLLIYHFALFSLMRNFPSIYAVDVALTLRLPSFRQ